MWGLSWRNFGLIIPPSHHPFQERAQRRKIFGGQYAVLRILRNKGVEKEASHRHRHRHRHRQLSSASASAFINQKQQHDWIISPSELKELIAFKHGILHIAYAYAPHTPTLRCPACFLSLGAVGHEYLKLENSVCTAESIERKKKGFTVRQSIDARLSFLRGERRKGNELGSTARPLITYCMYLCTCTYRYSLLKYPAQYCSYVHPGSARWHAQCRPK